MNPARTTLNYANVTATVALFLALAGGAALAADKIGSKQLKPNAVKSKHVKDGQLTGADVASDSLTGADVKESTLAIEGAGPPTGPANGDLAGSYPAPTIAANAIGSSEVIDDQLTGDDVNEGSLVGAAGLLVGRVNQLGGPATRFVPPQGTSTPTATVASQAAHGAPGGGQTVLRDLSVTLSGDLATGESREFTVVLGSGSETALSCEVGPGQSTCGDPGPVTINAGIGFAIKIDSSGAGLGLNEFATFGLEASH